MSTEHANVHGFLASVPLKYTYLLKSTHEQYLYQSCAGLWQPIDCDNQLITSLLPQGSIDEFQIIDNFAPLKKHLHLGESLSVLNSRVDDHLLHIKIDSHDQSGVKEHRRLLQHYHRFDCKSVVIEQSSYRCLFSSTGIKQEFVAQLDQLAHFCHVEIVVSQRAQNFSLSMNIDDSADQPKLRIYLLGDSEDTVFAETRLRILLDNMMGLFVDSVSVPLSLIPLVGGVDFGSFKAIAKETGVNLYLPTVLPELYTSSTKHNLDVIFLSGLEAQVMLARRLVVDVKEKVEQQLFYKNIDILKFKKDSILVNRKNELGAIMYKYGVFIQVSSLGFDESVVHFQGSSSELIEAAIDEFNNLTNEIYVADVCFHKKSAINDELEPARIVVDINEMKNLLCKISTASHTLIYADLINSSFKLVGSQNNAVKAVKLFRSSASQAYGQCSTRVIFHIELGLEHHEFISGKKNGKISKITNGSKCTVIDFHPLNEYSLLIELRADDFNDFLTSFVHFQNELPSEVKFYIPESFHRQIIGTGGSLIQSIMRKYNVFVKFSNSFDMKNNVKSLVRHDNVIVRCPFKNSSNIPLVKNELNSLLINNENITFFNTYIQISRNQYRLFNFDKVQEVEKATLTFIKFPVSEPSETAIVEILGTETHSINAARLLVAELAESYEFQITFSTNFHKIINDSNEKFVEMIKVPFKLLYNFELMAMDAKTIQNGLYHSIILSYLPGSDLNLEDAITFLTAFLREHEFIIMDRGELSNNDLIISGSAQKYSVAEIVDSKASSFTASYASGYHSLPSTANTNLSFPAPPTQQLYRLPNQQQAIPLTQPTMVQPRLNLYTKKRPTTHNGYERVYRR